MSDYKSIFENEENDDNIEIGSTSSVLTDVMESIFGTDEDPDEALIEEGLDEDDDADGLFNPDAPLTPADESAIFMEALRSQCTPEEFQELAIESAYSLELYGLIQSADPAMESQKNIVRLNKLATISSVQKRTAIRMGQRKNDVDYKNYKKHRDLMIEARAKLFKKYASASKTEAKKIMMASKHKASTMSTPAGKSIANKMDKAIKEADKNIRNHKAVKA